MTTSEKAMTEPPLTAGEPVVTVRGVTHRYGGTLALDGLDIDIPAGCMVGLIGPDGVGKSTLMGLVAGSKKIQAGTVHVLGGDMADSDHRDVTCPRIAYMPQGLGKNLYFDLSVFENIDFFARLFGVPDSERSGRIYALLEATGLGPFPDRPAGKLSGGMKQKVSLCGALIHDPDLLILDEPTTGVDPLSRQQFWNLIDRIRAERPGMSVLVSTAYMDEAQRFDWTIAMNAGRVIATGTPADLMQRTATTNLEEAFVALLPGAQEGGRKMLEIPPRVDTGGAPAIVATNLTKRFGKFTAVNDVSFTIPQGEIFGFLGSNGCGKSTTMKMLTGLLPATEGQAMLFGEPVNAEDLATRKRVGYMSQAFSLYGELTVRQNLTLHARIFEIPMAKARVRIDDLVDRFGLREHLDSISEELPLGLKQRLSLAVAVLHEPDLLLLDEPTSGVDPVARDEFWELLIDLSRNQGVTIFVSTHFMNEAMRCDRISLMHAGTVLACDTPAKLVEARGSADLENAFISYIAEAEAVRKTLEDSVEPAGSTARHLAGTAAHAPTGRFSLGRLMAYARRETQEIQRDPVRLLFAFAGSAALMLAFGFGITMDVEDIRFSSLDLDNTPESRAYLAGFEGSRYFLKKPPIQTPDELDERLKSNEIEVALEIEPQFGRNLHKANVGEVIAWIDGAPTNRAESVAQYVQGVHYDLLKEQARNSRQSGAGMSAGPSFDIETRFTYNPTFESVYAIVPSVPPMLLILIPAILMAVSVVREKELGSIVNFYVTPTRRLEFLVGKQLPYIAVGMVNHVVLMVLGIAVFGVPLKGDGLMLTLCALIYVTSTTAVGMLVASFTTSQVAAVFATAILTILPTTQFSGMLQPVSTLSGGARILGTLWPTTYYMHASVGAFTKSLGFAELWIDAVILALFVPVFIGLSVAGLPRQET